MELKKVILNETTGAVGVSLILEMVANGIEVTAVCCPNSKRLSVIPSHPLVNIVECDIPACPV